MNPRYTLIHLHFDIEKHLEPLLRRWNETQDFFEFVGIRPGRKLEQSLLNPGAISDDEASQIADQIRTSAGFQPGDGIIVFTEKRLFDVGFYQLFVGGREADETPPNISVISLDFLRKLYKDGDARKSRFFSAIISNILFSIGIDAGLADHGDETRGCIMDFCDFMTDIDIGVVKGPTFCQECRHTLESTPKIGPAMLTLLDGFNHFDDLDLVDRDVTEAIFLRGEQRSKDQSGFEYDVALSFSSRDRNYAENLASQMRSKGIKVIYDKSEQADIWGKNLQTHLTELYRVRARYCIVIISANYVTSRWTKIELEAALAREFESDDTYILPIRLDDTLLSSLLSTRAFIDARLESIEKIVSLVKIKLDGEKSVSFNR